MLASLIETAGAVQLLAALPAAGLVIGWRLAGTPPLPRTRHVLALVALLATAALVPLDAARVLGLAPDAVWRPAAWLPGVTWQPLLALALAAAGLVGALLPGRGTWVTLLLLAAPVATGHSVSVTPHPLMVGADVVHLLVGAFWAGGLLALARLLADRAADPRHALDVAGRFSALAAWSVGLIVVSGLGMAWLVLGGRWTSLLTTAWGHLLLLKVALVAGVLPIAGWNRWRLLPALHRALAAESGTHDVPRRDTETESGAVQATPDALDVSPGPADAEPVPRHAPPEATDARPGAVALHLNTVAVLASLRRAVGWEALVLAALLTVTGVLTTQSPHEMTAAAAVSAETTPATVASVVPVIGSDARELIAAAPVELGTPTDAAPETITPAERGR